MATSNIVRLPTAAARQVNQRSVKAVRAYKAANPWPGEYVPRFERERRARDEIMRGMERTPALLLAMATLAYADEAVQAKVVATAELATLATPGCVAARQALILARRLTGNLSPEARIINAACPNGEG